MKALTIASPPDVNSLELIDTPKSAPKKGEALVRMTSIGLNRGDLLFCQNRYFHKPNPGSRIGFEGAGIIEALGDSHSNYKVGDRVAICPMSFDVNTEGCLAEYGNYAIESLIPTPETIPDSDAASIWMAYLTAWGGMVDSGGLTEGEAVVITAASSSVGIAAIQIANMIGAVSIATTTSQEKADKLLELGAQHVIVQSRGEDANQEYVDEIYKITNKQGSDLVFDAVAGPATHGLVKASKRGARIVIQGMLDRRPMDIHAGVLMKRLLTLKGYTVDQTLNNSVQKEHAIGALSSGFASGQLTPIIASYNKLTNFKAAFQELSANKHIGKIVVMP